MSKKKRAQETEGTSYATQPWIQLLRMQSDLEAMALTVMMEAATSAQVDLKAIMAGVKAINACKERLRETMARVNRDAAAAARMEADGGGIEFPPHGLQRTSGYERVERPVPDPEAPGGVRFAQVSLIDGDITSVRQLEAAKDALTGQLDSLSEMGEMESLRLQMAMDRHSRMMSTLSNIMKKMSDTSGAITSNLK
jgi:hypothetical protein